LIDNDLGPDAGARIGLGLSKNTVLKSLKVSENSLKAEGAISIIKNAERLATLHISK
jgi:hypothetical protein